MGGVVDQVGGCGPVASTGCEDLRLLICVFHLTTNVNSTPNTAEKSRHKQNSIFRRRALHTLNRHPVSTSAHYLTELMEQSVSEWSAQNCALELFC